MTKIMLVEDDNNLREIYQARLNSEGYETVTASDGEEALSIVGREKPDLIILDVMMPKISGFDTLDLLKNSPLTKDIKVIMMTALSQAEDRARAEKLGAQNYLVKSQVTLEDIVKAVKDAISGVDAYSTTPSSDSTPSTTTSVFNPVQVDPSIAPATDDSTPMPEAEPSIPEAQPSAMFTPASPEIPTAEPVDNPTEVPMDVAPVDSPVVAQESTASDNNTVNSVDFNPVQVDPSIAPATDDSTPMPEAEPSIPEAQPSAMFTPASPEIPTAEPVDNPTEVPMDVAPVDSPVVAQESSISPVANNQNQSIAQSEPFNINTQS